AAQRRPGCSARTRRKTNRRGVGTRTATAISGTSPLRARYSLSKSVQVSLGSHVDGPVGYRRCGENAAVKLVSAKYIQFLTGLQHHHHALFRGNVDLLVGSHWRRIVVA